MAEEWFAEGVQICEDGTDEFFAEGVQWNENQDGGEPPTFLPAWAQKVNTLIGGGV
jgi:hypothetical protein